MPIFASGTLNTTALVVPNLYVQILAPQVALLNGVPSNILGIVGTATWGPTNQPLTAALFADVVRQYGSPQPRKYDMATAAAMAIYQGANNMRLVRVSDGTDTAASISIGTSNLTLTGKYTGTLGNQAVATVSAGTAANTWRVAINIPGQIQELFDNIASGISSVTVVAGTGYTSVPSASVSAPNATSGPLAQAVVQATLTTLPAPALVTGGTSGFAVNDLLNFPNGIILKVSTVASGVVTAVTVINAGSIVGGSVPSNPVAMTSTSGAGIGTPTFTFTWGLGAATIVSNGQGYLSGTITLSGGGGSGGTYTPVTSYWGNMATAINSGQSGIRGPSNIVVASSPTGTTTPVAASYTLTGGTDGAGAVNGATLVGVDTTPRKGMYALRGSQASIGVLADCDDWTQATYQVAYGISEGTYMVGVTPAGDTITNAIANKAIYGIDSYAFKVMFGDWLIWNDPYNNVQRTVSPQGAAAGLLSNLSPQNVSLNKTLYGFQGTQRQLSGAPYSLAELTQLIGAGFDVVTNPAPAGNIFACASGHNSSSNAVIQSDQYTRLTNYIAATFNQVGGMGQYVGKLNTAATWRQALSTVNAFLTAMQTQSLIVGYTAKMDATNNPQSRTALGYGQMDVRVQYPGILEKFLLNVEGGASVSIVSKTAALAA
jgi:hypothetical protein